ncbi:MFS transporter [Novosphingobium malaysiense]|uniref:MFS transporter n=2 Tax=Novosphingobium malaysiense TaxID=1348853 RepID=A0A0B1ZN28_9SPHN|nr:MFS transporter [Novosphingobium malaysiense]
MNAVSRQTMPRTVWALGFVSMFMDVSSEMIHSLLPLYLTVTLGASVAVVGVIDGVAEATASITKVFSGYLSDAIGRRKPMLFLGYGMATLSKPLFALAGTPTLVFTARFIDRIGKGLRGAPRDALIADATPEEIRGRAYGLRQAMDTAGAFAGPLAAIFLMAVLGDDMRSVFWIAAVPGVLAVLVVVFGVRDREPPTAREPAPPLRMRELGRFGRPFWMVVAVGVAFTMARFSEAFLVLRATSQGLPITLAPAVLVVMNLVFSLGAYPAGVLADQKGPFAPLLAGIAAILAADVVLAYGDGLPWMFAGIVLWGVHMAFTQGLLAQLVAATAPENLRGTAFGAFNLATGVTMLLASALAGVLWDLFGPAATFMGGAVFAAGAALLLLMARRQAGRSPAT